VQRDGEQTPGGAMTLEQKLVITEILAELGLDVLEVGFPASAGDLSSKISESDLRNRYPNTKVCVLARMVKSDIDAAKTALNEVNPGCKVIHTFLATSPVHRELKLGGKSISEICETIKTHISYISKDRNPDGSPIYEIIFSPEDATNTPIEDLKKVVKVAVESGASTINIPDTLGIAQPEEIYSLIKEMIIYTRSLKLLLGLNYDIKIAFHGHDDSGLAVANTLAAIKAGIDQIQTTPSGQGERSGNTALIRVIMAMMARPDIYSRYKTNLNYSYFAKAIQEIDKIMGTNYFELVKRQFLHASGIHQAQVAKSIIQRIENGAIIKDGLLFDPFTNEHIEIRDVYQPINANELGFRSPFYGLVLTKHSGMAGVKAVLMMSGCNIDEMDKVEIAYKNLVAANSVEDLDSPKTIFTAEDVMEYVNSLP